MGKKVKKKSRNTHKERPVSSGSHGTTRAPSNPVVEIVGDGVSVLKERKPCTHIDRSIDLDKISSKIGSQDSVRCEDCREGALDRRESKGRSKHGKKKGTSPMGTKKESKSVWICLECGHFSCGGVGLPTTPQCHTLRHSKQSRHPCVIQFDNPHLWWCFPCNSLIPVEKSEENGDHKDILTDTINLIKGRSSGRTSVDVEDVWFGNDNVRDVTAESKILDGRGGYVVRGLMNLGNTCFFNSVMQNLLAMDQLRDYLLNLDQSVGPLTIALKKLFNETSLEAESRYVINPKTLFGCICAKCPQFRGYQQQDSHELLRYLLDGLCTEDLGAKKLLSSSGEDGITSNLSPIFVDMIFGGKLSSTVCCVECNHSSVVYEPFLDLSLPVPIKIPPSKKASLASRTKKMKLPLKKEIKKGGNNRGKGKTNTAPLLVQCPTGPSESKDSSSSELSAIPAKEETVTSLDDFAWLDYIGPETTSNGPDSVLQNEDSSNFQDSENRQVFQSDNMLQNNLESQSQVYSPNGETKPDLDSSWGNSCEDERPLHVQSSEVLLLPYKEDNSPTEEMVSKIGEASSSSVGCRQDMVEFDGFGDLFNEPEMVSVPNSESLLGDKNFQANDVIETGFLAGNISESDPDEVDDTDAPVSIDSCLSRFTKPELLSNEHAWHCENCSKILRGQQVKARENQPKTTGKPRINGGQFRSQNAPLDLYGEFPSSNTELGNLDKPCKFDSDIGSTNAVDSLVSYNELDDSSPKYTIGETNTLDKEDSEFLKAMPSSHTNDLEVSQRDKDRVELSHTPREVSPNMAHHNSISRGSFHQARDACNADEPDSIGSNADQVQSREFQLSTRVHESDDCEEVDSESVKVKRTATKRILINRAPLILTIHLKRFSQDFRGRSSKLNGHVSFQDTIDLRPYMDPSCNEKDRYDYHLVGVVEHTGTMRGGHYVAYVRAKKSGGKTENEGGGFTWFYASDSHVREVSLAEVLRSEAYILFYEKI